MTEWQSSIKKIKINISKIQAVNKFLLVKFVKIWATKKGYDCNWAKYIESIKFMSPSNI